MATINDFYRFVASYHDCDFDAALNNEIVLSNEMKELIFKLNKIFNLNINLLMARVDNIEMTIDNVNKGAQYIKDNFSVHSVSSITEENEKLLLEKLKKIKGKDILDLRRTLAYAKYCDLISPFNIKVLINQNDELDGDIVLRYVNSDGKMCKEFEPFFDGIHINSLGSNTADLSYVHEITHTQVESYYNSYSNLLHMETLSILLEMIYTSDSCNSQKINGVKFSNIGEFINYSEFIKCNELVDKIYFYSRYFALELYSIYCTADKKEQQKMKYLIQDVFDGKISVEDLCSEYNVEFNKPHQDIIVRSLVK